MGDAADRETFDTDVGDRLLNLAMIEWVMLRWRESAPEYLMQGGLNRRRSP
jgi:hypothetical protein